MKQIIVSLVSVAFALLPFNTASAYSHANRYGGSTSHSYGSTSHSSAYGTSTSHTYGEGSSHTNEYGGSTSHNYYGGTSHTNAYGGTTSGEAGYGATHTNTYGATTAYHPPADAYYHPPAPYYPYHPPTTVGYYGAGCYNCASTAGAAAAGAVVGATVGAARSFLAKRSRLAERVCAGLQRGAPHGQCEHAANANAAAANANAAAANANAAAARAPRTPWARSMGRCLLVASNPAFLGRDLLLVREYLVQPAYGANGVYYKVVPAP